MDTSNGEPTSVGPVYQRRMSVFVASALLMASVGASAEAEDRQAKVLRDFEQKTGLTPIEIPGTQGQYLGKTHRGYEVVFTAKAGDVWGRYAARLAMGEIVREVGGVLAFLTGGQEWGHGAAGSTLDRILANAIGQPLSMSVLLRHGRSQDPRLDIYQGFSNVKPDEGLPEMAKVGSGAGRIHSLDASLAGRIAEDEALMKRLKKLRGQYIRVDETAVTLIWSGQEKDMSAMIRDHGGYWKMINAFLDDVADIADLLPGPEEQP